MCQLIDSAKFGQIKRLSTDCEYICNKCEHKFLKKYENDSTSLKNSTIEIILQYKETAWYVSETSLLVSMFSALDCNFFN